MSSPVEREPLHRRSGLEMRFDILRAIRDGPSGKQIPTRIMYYSNLSWTMMSGILTDLQAREFILKEIKRPSNKDTRNVYVDGPEIWNRKEGQAIFVLTQKGRDILLSYEKLLAEMNAERDPPKTQMIKIRNRGFKFLYPDGSEKTSIGGLVAD